jgi:hypothetical protein
MAGTAKRPAKRPARKVTGRLASVSNPEDLSAEELAALQAEAEAALDEIVETDDDGRIKPVEIGKRGRTPNQLVHLFTLDGRKFYVPEKPSPMVTLRFLRTMRTEGQAAAVEELLLKTLGQEAVDALAASPDVEDEDMAAIFGAITKIVFGNLSKQQEATQGNS